jgi:hypothetical protein
MNTRQSISVHPAPIATFCCVFAVGASAQSRVSFLVPGVGEKFRSIKAPTVSPGLYRALPHTVIVSVPEKSWHLRQFERRPEMHLDEASAFPHRPPLTLEPLQPEFA